MIENPHNSGHMPDEPALDPSALVPPAMGAQGHGQPRPEEPQRAVGGDLPADDLPPDDAAPEAAHGSMPDYQRQPPLGDAGAPGYENPASPAVEASGQRDEAAGGQPPVEESPGEAASEGPVAEEPSVESLAGSLDEEPIDEGPIDEGPIDEEEVEPHGPIEETPVAELPPQMDWYILKVQSNREESIRESLQRRVKVAGLERFFGEIIVPTEMVSEFKGGKKRVVKRKLYPGYIVAHMEINDETWFLVRETPGIGDFTGSAGKPTPMLPHEVAKIVAKQEDKADEAPKLKINFNVGDRVKITDGTFENFEGEVDSIDEASGRVNVMINIFGRSTPVELEYWQVETI